MMKNICVKMLLFVLSLISISNSQIRDSIFLKIEPDSISIGDSLLEITCTIDNFSSDTILIINEFYLEGLTRNTLVYPRPNQYSVNTIFFTTKGFPYFEADGKFPKEYLTFPPIILIPPKTCIDIKVNIDYYKDLLLYKKWDVSAYFRLADKKSLNAIIEKFSDSKNLEFKNSILEETNLYFNNSVISDSLKSGNLKNDYSVMIDSIKKVFNILLIAN